MPCVMLVCIHPRPKCVRVHLFQSTCTAFKVTITLQYGGACLASTASASSQRAVSAWRSACSARKPAAAASSSACAAAVSPTSSRRSRCALAASVVALQSRVVRFRHIGSLHASLLMPLLHLNRRAHSLGAHNLISRSRKNHKIT